MYIFIKKTYIPNLGPPRIASEFVKHQNKRYRKRTLCLFSYSWVGKPGNCLQPRSGRTPPKKWLLTLVHSKGNIEPPQIC